MKLAGHGALYNNNKELMTEDDFEKTSLETMEKLMKPVELKPPGKAAACTEGGVP